MICPKCGQKFSRLKIPWTETSNEMSGYNCPKCGVRLKVKNLKEIRLSSMKILPIFLTSFAVFFIAYEIYFNKHYSEAFLIIFFPIVLILLVVFYEKSLSNVELMITDEEPRPQSEIIAEEVAKEKTNPETRSKKREAIIWYWQVLLAAIFIFIMKIASPPLEMARIMTFVWGVLAVLQFVNSLVFAISRKEKLLSITGTVVYNLFIIVATLKLINIW